MLITIYRSDGKDGYPAGSFGFFATKDDIRISDGGYATAARAEQAGRLIARGYAHPAMVRVDYSPLA